MKAPIVFVLSTLVAIACGDSGTTPDDGGTDATKDVAANDVNAVDSPADVTPDAIVDAGPLCDPQKPFGAPVMLTSLNLHADAGSAAGNSRQPRLSSDLRTAYFNDGSSIYSATRPTASGDTFASPTLLASISAGDAGIDTSPNVSPDGLTMYFASTRSGTSSLYVSTRAHVNDAFAAPSLVTGLPSVPITIPFLQGDGTTLYFGDGTNVYRATVSGAVATSPTTLTELASAQAVSGGIAVTGDGLTAYFSRGVGTDGGAIPHYKIWSATRASTSAPFGNFAYSVELNTPNGDQVDNDDIAFVSADGCVALLTSFRDAGSNVYEARKPL